MNVAPVLLHTRELVKVTALPLPPPVAATMKLLPLGAIAGALRVKMILCAAMFTVKLCVTGVAAAYAPPAWEATIVQVPLAPPTTRSLSELQSMFQML